MDNGLQKALLVRITGRVQGVGFRAWTLIEAGKLGIRGWVRNDRDGSVAALIAGPEVAVATMLDRVRHGPPGAMVANLEAGPAPSVEAPPGFRIAG